MSRRRSVVIVPLLALVATGGIAAAVVSRATADVAVRTVTVGRAPYWTLTVDERTSRAFVFNRQDGTLNVLDTRTGTLLRTVTLTPGNVWLAVAERAGRVFVSGYDTGTITMLDARSGAVLHSVANGTDMGLAVDEGTNHVFVGSANSTMIMLDARSGAVLRRLPVCHEPFAIAVSARTGHVFAKCDDGTTDMLDARTGRVLHTIANNSGSYGAMLVDEQTNRVFTVGNRPQLDVLDARTGEYLHTLAFDATAWSPVADERTGRVYLTLGDANAVTAPPHKSEVAVLDGQSGALLRRIPVAANPFSLAIDPWTGRVLVGSAGPLDSLSDLPTGDGTLSVLDAARGRVLRAIRIGAGPSDVAIDAQAKRALVVNSYSDTHGKGALKAWRPRESWWPQALRRVKQVICCLPFQAPAPPAPTTNGTVTTLDLSHL